MSQHLRFTQRSSSFGCGSFWQEGREGGSGLGTGQLCHAKLNQYDLANSGMREVAKLYGTELSSSTQPPPCP